VNNYMYDDIDLMVKVALEKESSIYRIWLNSQQFPELILVGNRNTPFYCLMDPKTQEFSELNPDYIKEKWNKWLLQKKIEEEEKALQREKEEFRVVVLSNSPHLRYDKWVNTREDFLEVYSSDRSLLSNRIRILSRFANNEEILEIINDQMMMSPLSEAYFCYLFKLMDLCVERGIDYDIYYNDIPGQFPDGTILPSGEQFITIPYKFFIDSDRMTLKPFFKLLKEYKFDLNKDINYGGPLPFHSLGYSSNEDFKLILDACVEAGYDLNTKDTETHMTIPEMMSLYLENNNI